MRRRLAVLAFVSLALVGVVMRTAGLRLDAVSLAQASPVVAPAVTWSMTIRQIQDPYLGTVLSNNALDAGLRYIGVQVILDAGDFALTVKATNVHLRDTEGEEFSSGAVFGNDVRILDRQLQPGESESGWVWFVVPLTARIDQIVFLPVNIPELRVPYAIAPFVPAAPATPMIEATKTIPAAAKTPASTPRVTGTRTPSA